MIVIGLMGGRSGELDLGALLRKHLSLIGSTLRARPDSEKAGIVAAFRERFGEALEVGRIAPVIDSVLPLERAAEAHRGLASGRTFGKIVLTTRSALL
jgi:NADPH:quinone reductase-like Zn-dependent oxidoreductase